MPPQTVLVVGNGLAIDLVTRSDPALLGEWHPGRPLSWNVTTHDGRQLPVCLPNFYAEVDSIRGAESGASDFAVIDEVVRRARLRQVEAEASGQGTGGPIRYAALRLDMEARHFLGLAYSALDAELRARGNLVSWPWLDYLRGLGPSLLAVMSFNYDTVMEHVLDAAGASFFHCGFEPQTGVPLGKPHGSIDYAMASNVLDIGGPPDYPINSVVALMNAPMVRLPGNELAKPRLHVEVVPPLGATAIRHFQWVAPIFDAFDQLGPYVERCVFLGVSGWPVDQPELVEVLRTLGSDAEVVVANPDPRPGILLDFHARRAGLRPITRWRDGPE